jgi:hypothetical protein
MQAPAQLGLPDARLAHGLIKGQLRFGQRWQNHEVPALSAVGGWNVAVVFDVSHESRFHGIYCAQAGLVAVFRKGMCSGTVGISTRVVPLESFESFIR